MKKTEKIISSKVTKKKIIKNEFQFNKSGSIIFGLFLILIGFIIIKLLFFQTQEIKEITTNTLFTEKLNKPITDIKDIDNISIYNNTFLLSNFYKNNSYLEYLDLANHKIKKNAK